MHHQVLIAACTSSQIRYNVKTRHFYSAQRMHCRQLPRLELLRFTQRPETPPGWGTACLFLFGLGGSYPAKDFCTFTALFPSLTHSNLCMGSKKQLDWLQLLSAGAHVKWTVRKNEKYVCLIALSQHGKTKRKMRNNNEQGIIIIVWLHYLSACQLNIHRKSSSV